MVRPIITHQELLEEINYYPDTGKFTRKNGKDLLRKSSNGVMVAYLFGFTYTAGQLAWLYMTGKLPPKDKFVCFRNNNSEDFRFSNLFLASRSRMLIGKTTKSEPTLRGTKYLKSKHSKPWASVICIDNKKIYLGYYDTPKEAHERYKKARREFRLTGKLTVSSVRDGTTRTFSHV